MSVNMTSEEELRRALNPYRVDPEKFEAAVRERVKENAGREYDPLATMSPLLRSAASFLPLEVFTAGQVTGTAAQSAPISGVFSKLLGYAAFPAISLFVLLGSAIFGATKIRRIQNQTSSGPLSGSPSGAIDEQARRASSSRWWHEHRRGASLLIFVTTFALSWFGLTWMLFLGYIVSTLILLYILESFASSGIGNRLVVGQSCVTGLAFLGQVAVFTGIGDRDIHLMDQALLAPLFFAGALAVALVSAWGGTRIVPVRRLGLFAIFVLAFVVWFMSPLLWPATPPRIRAYVESFDRAEFSSASWHQWEIAARWVVKSNPAPDLSRPRRLLAEEIAGQQSPDLPSILNSALRVGLVRAEQVRQLTNYEERLRSLLDAPISDRISLGFDDWVVRAAVLRQDLTSEQRDHLAERVHSTLRWSLTRQGPAKLEDPLRATQLLEVLGRPVDSLQYQEDVHALLKRLHHETGGGFQRAGGFQSYPEIHAGDLNATSDAIELMEIYGIPKGLDLNWDRSFLRPSFLQMSPENWIAAVTLDRLNRLPGATYPSWFEILYFERSFLAAAILIGLCIYATVISPNPIGVSHSR